MAVADGQAPPLPPEAIQEHLRQCADCRREAAALAGVCVLLDGQRRAACDEDLWPGIEAALAGEETGAADKPAGAGKLDRYLLAGLAVLLAGWRLGGAWLGLELSWAARLLPVVLAAAAFVWLGANPFRIDPDLEPQGAQHEA